MYALVFAAVGLFSSCHQGAVAYRRSAQDSSLIVWTKKQMFLPIRALPEERAKWKELRLVVSRNKGKTWMVGARLKPWAGSISIKVHKNGEYWFAVQVVYKDGTKVPRILKETEPGIKVRVNITQISQRPKQTPKTRKDSTQTPPAEKAKDEAAAGELYRLGKQMRRLDRKMAGELFCPHRGLRREGMRSPRSKVIQAGGLR